MSSLRRNARFEARLARRQEARFARSLERLAANDPTFAHVNFAGWGIGNEGARRLVEALRGNTVVTWLGLRDNGISAALVLALAGVIKNSTSLKVLDLRGNNIGANGASVLARFLRNNTFLSGLSLSNCGIGAEGVRVLAEALLNNSSFTHVCLGGNELCDVGVSALAKMIPGNSTLTSLKLENNEISDAGAIALAEALLHNCSLTLLDLQRNSISDVGGRQLANALLINSSISVLILGGNEINLRRNDISEALKRLVDELAQFNADATNPQEALERKIEWLRNLDEGGLLLLGFKESGLEEEVRRLRIVCRVGWLIDSGVDGEKEEAVTLVLDHLDYFPQAYHRRRLFGRLLGAPECGVEVAASVDGTRGRALYWYAVQCGATPGVLMSILRVHPSLCTCKDVRHRLYPFMLLATVQEAKVGDVMELLLLAPNLVGGGIHVAH